MARKQWKGRTSIFSLVQGMATSIEDLLPASSQEKKKRLKMGVR